MILFRDSFVVHERDPICFLKNDRKKFPSSGVSAEHDDETSPHLVFLYNFKFTLQLFNFERRLRFTYYTITTQNKDKIFRAFFY